MLTKFQCQTIKITGFTDTNILLGETEMQNDEIWSFNALFKLSSDLTYYKVFWWLRGQTLVDIAQQLLLFSSKYSWKRVLRALGLNQNSRLLLFLHHRVEYLKINQLVNFYQNRTSQAFKDTDFVFFFLKTHRRPLHSENPRKKTSYHISRTTCNNEFNLGPET